jgi:hypothetical protein
VNTLECWLVIIFHHIVILVDILSAMVYALQKFRHYLLGKHFKMFTYHSTLKYLVNKPVLGGIICRWLLLFQEFEFEVTVKPRKLNVGPNHLSRVTNGEEPTNLEENFSDT